MEVIPVDIALLKSLLSLATVVEARDPYTGGHTWRVSRYARLLAEYIGLTDDEVFVVHFGSLMHDIGKVSIPDPILNKEGKLTSVEYEVIKKHPETGLALVREHPLGMLAHQIVTSHHERFDGLGYPGGLAGKRIPLFARITAIADGFDAMTSPRPYRAGMPVETAYRLLNQESGKQFDPILVSAFLDLGRRGALDPIMGHSAEERPLYTCASCGPILVIPADWKSGERVVCPRCLSNYDVHLDGWDFKLERDPSVSQAWVPQPDTATVDEVTHYAPSELRLPPSFGQVKFSDS